MQLCDMIYFWALQESLQVFQALSWEEPGYKVSGWNLVIIDVHVIAIREGWKLVISDQCEMWMT